ncbi:MAG: chromate transporter, partial [Candidatus Eisenbacteria bacterium]
MLLVGATFVLALLDLSYPDGIYAWTFVGVVVVCAAVAFHGGRTQAPASGARETVVTPRALFRESLILGLTGFGGGLAVLSQIEHRLVEGRRWIPMGRFLETAAIAQGLPGAAAANALALIGFDLGGVTGAVAGTAGFVLPSFLMLMVAGLLYPILRDVAAVDGIFRGLDPA